MRKRLALMLMLVTICPAFCQTASKYQPGTITAVTAHQQDTGRPDSEVVQYDVSVKIDNTVYVVLYTPPNGLKNVEYAPGIEMLFSVGKETITFNSALSGKTEVPILRREVLPAQSGLDWSKAPGQYFSMKLRHLSETLALTEDQQAKIKPILEQEAGELGPYWNNPVVSRKDKLLKLQRVVLNSDTKIKPLLSEIQLQKLQELRKEQEQELKQRIAEKPIN